MPETLVDVGEFGLIHRIRKLIQDESVMSAGLTLGIGDDAASFQPRPGYEVLVTCDCMVENRHYLPEYITPLDLGRRAMAVNISDIGAMGGQPKYALVSLGLKADTFVTDVEAMYRGFIAELIPFSASVIGGNITKTKDAPFIDITLIGEIEKGKLVRRSTAKADNAILVTGYPGQAAAGFQLLLNSKPSDDLQNHPLVRAYNTPTPRAREGQAVARSGYATAMIDTSDGFLGDLGHICEESKVGAVIIQEKIPISKDLRLAAEQLRKDPYELFLKDSDDYELVITCSPSHVAQIRAAIATVSSVPVSEVGMLTESRGDIKLTLPDGTQHRITPTGWDHFVR